MDSQGGAQRNFTLKAPEMTQTVDENGGTLVLDRTGISLEIPSGALDKAVDITLTVVWNDDTPAPECNVAPRPRCLPNGLSFLKPVTLKIPHCAVLPEGKKPEVNVWKRDDTSGILRKTPDPTAEVTDDHILWKLDHF